MVEDPGALQQLVLDVESLVSGEVLEIEQLAEPKEEFLLNALDLDLDDVYGVLEHGVVPFLGAQDLYLGKEVQAVHLP